MPLEALKTQVGGDHYKKMNMQPLEFILANDLDYLTASIIKYITRDKGKHLEDLQKARQCVDVLIEKEESKLSGKG